MALWGKPKNNSTSTQDILKFAEIREGVVVTKNGELRAILMASSINFALKSEQEQNAIVFAYQNFLNSLEFPIQIVMQSRKLDLGNYLKKLKEVSGTQTNELLRAQTLDYIDFISRLINIANIMDKKFYIAVSYTPPPKIQSLPGQPQQTNQITMAEFKTYKQELDQRVAIAQNGLGSIGLRLAQLDTQQIIELLYGIYNPEEATREKLTPVEQLTANVVQSELEKNEPTK